MIAGKRRVTAYLKAAVGTDPATSRPTLEWHLDESAIGAEAATDGWYALLTNLGPDVDTAGVFRHYKGKEAPERRCHNFKGPLAVTPMFLKNNRRIEALISVICLALLISPSSSEPPVSPRPPPLQARILDLLHVDPRQPRCKASGHEPGDNSPACAESPTSRRSPAFSG